MAADNAAENVSALDGLRQEKFNLSLLTDWICFFLKSARGISQSTSASIAHPGDQVKSHFQADGSMLRLWRGCLLLRGGFVLPPFRNLVLTSLLLANSRTWFMLMSCCRGF